MATVFIELVAMRNEEDEIAARMPKWARILEKAAGKRVKG
jgi:hypothetical protein